MNLLLELLDTSHQDAEIVKMKPYINKIAGMLFKQKAGPVVDPKRSKLPKYFGITDTESTITDDSGKHLRLTFDNSTDSGEFELNSLSPLMIEKGSQLEAEIKKLYAEHEVKSKKRVNYIMRSGKKVIREIHLGKDINERTIRLVSDLIALLKLNKSNTVGE